MDEKEIIYWLYLLPKGESLEKLHQNEAYHVIENDFAEVFIASDLLLQNEIHFIEVFDNPV